MFSKCKSFLAVILALILVFSLTSCFSADKSSVDSDETTVISDEQITKSEKETSSSSKDEEITEKDSIKKSSAYLKKAIAALMAVEYNGYSRDFINFDIYNQPEREIALIGSTDYTDITNPSLYPIDYNWYKNGVVDENLLYERIVENNTKANIRMTSDCKRIAKMIAYVAQYNINYLKKKVPSFNFNIPLYHLDNVTVNTSDENWYYSLYVYDFNRILVNLENIKTEEFFRSTISHEVFHLFARGQIGLEELYIAGSGYDTLKTEERPLEQNFINEWFVENASYAAFGDKMDENLYAYEKELIQLLCISTGKDIFDLEAPSFGVGNDYIYYSFEKEVRTPNFVYSTLCAYDCAADYAYKPENVNDSDFKSDCEIYGTINLLKNMYIRLLKEIKTGEITYKEACEVVEEMNIALDIVLYEESPLNSVKEEMETIFFTYAVKL